MNLKYLQKEIPYQWRLQSFSKTYNSAQCVAYIDSRDVQRILDEVVGAENWQDDYKLIDEKLFAGIGIYHKETNQWIWKWDTGTESNIEKEKGQSSDAFKRAGVKWGIGRFLYDLEIKVVKTDETKRFVVDDNGKRVYNLTEYINNLKK